MIEFRLFKWNKFLNKLNIPVNPGWQLQNKSTEFKIKHNAPFRQKFKGVGHGATTIGPVVDGIMVVVDNDVVVVLVVVEVVVTPPIICSHDTP